MKKLLLMLLGVLMSLTAMAQDFEYTYEGQTLTYSVLDEDEKTCQTKAGGYLTAGNNISGDLIIPAEVSDGTSTYRVTAIGKYGFYGASLTSVSLPNSVTLIDAYAFGNCKGLTAVTMPNSVTALGERAFAWCSVLTTLTIPDSVTSIGAYAFYYCTGLTSVVISNSLTLIDECTFANCSGLTTVTIPNSVTVLGESAFAWCSGLTAVAIPGTVTSIGDNAFYYCNGLKEINYITQQPVAADRMVFSNDTYKTATLNVAYGGLDNAKMTEPWMYFENISENVPTSINEIIDNFEVNATIEVYDLNGVHIANATDGLAPGIYIIRQASKVSKIAVK